MSSNHDALNANPRITKKTTENSTLKLGKKFDELLYHLTIILKPLGTFLKVQR
jgi:hypothetical protein